jgi:hypothetical protein
MVTMPKWGHFTIAPHPHAVTKSEQWTTECEIKFDIGFNDCLKNEKMLMLKGSAICATLENEKKNPYLFPTWRHSQKI